MEPLTTTAQITPNQLLLLKAALFPPAEALPYWQTWKQNQGLGAVAVRDENLLSRLFGPLDSDSQRLMPLVYRNLERTDDPLVPHLQAVYRHTWMSNQRFLRKAVQLTTALREAGIPGLLLKGLPLALGYYGDLGVRLMLDLDVLVPTECAEEALHCLKAPPVGLKVNRIAPRFWHVLHAVHGQSEEVEVDLHWHALAEHAYPGADAPFWAGRKALALPGGGEAFALSPTHQLFHTIAHGCHHNLAYGYHGAGSPALRWVADCHAVYTRFPQALDWDELLQLAEIYRLQIPLYQALQLLRTEFKLMLPESIARRLETLPISERERVYYAQMQAPPKRLGRYLRYFRHLHLTYGLFRSDKPVPPFRQWLFDKVRYGVKWRVDRMLTNH